MTGITNNNDYSSSGVSQTINSPADKIDGNQVDSTKDKPTTQGYDNKNSMSTNKSPTQAGETKPIQPSDKPTLEQLIAGMPPATPDLKSARSSLEQPLDFGFLYIAEAFIKPDPLLMAEIFSTLEVFVDGTKLPAGDAESQYEGKQIINSYMKKIRDTIDGQVMNEMVSSGSHSIFGFKPVDMQFTKDKLEQLMTELLDKLNANMSTTVQKEIEIQKLKKHQDHLKKMKNLEDIRHYETQLKKEATTVCDKKGQNKYGQIDHGFTKQRVDKSARKWAQQKISTLKREVGALSRLAAEYPVLFSNLLANGQRAGNEVEETIIDNVMNLLELRDLDINIFQPETDAANNEVQSGSAVEGIAITRDSFSQAEFMLILLQLQEANENTKKLEEVIGLLQSGNPKAAAEALSSIKGSLNMGDTVNQDNLASMINYFIHGEVLTPEETSNIETMETFQHLQNIDGAAADQIDLQEQNEPPKTYVQG